MSGVGRMPGGRTKSEGGPNDREAETAMLIEKAIMPLFPAGFNHNVTVSAQEEAFVKKTHASPAVTCKLQQPSGVARHRWCI